MGLINNLYECACGGRAGESSDSDYHVYRTFPKIKILKKDSSRWIVSKLTKSGTKFVHGRDGCDICR
jgi:hypothetical protein